MIRNLLNEKWQDKNKQKQTIFLKVQHIFLCFNFSGWLFQDEKNEKKIQCCERKKKIDNVWVSERVRKREWERECQVVN